MSVIEEALAPGTIRITGPTAVAYALVTGVGLNARARAGEEGEGLRITGGVELADLLLKSDAHGLGCGDAEDLAREGAIIWVDIRADDVQIEGLRASAAAAGDTKQVVLCDAALSGDREATRSCTRAIVAAVVAAVEAS